MPRQNNIQFRKGSYSQWDANSTTVLGSGEPGFATDLNILKIGDGTKQWSDLQAINESLITIVRNDTGSTINKMSVVYINGAQGDTPRIALGIASGEAASSKTYGLTVNNISNGGTGIVVVDGTLRNLDTNTQFSALSEGTALWLSPTVSGGITSSKPYAPNHSVFVGTLIRKHSQQGVINVKIQNGYELEELHNVATTGATNGQFLQYNSGSGLWFPSSSGNFNSLSINGISAATDNSTIVRITGNQNIYGSKYFDYLNSTSLNIDVSGYYNDYYFTINDIAKIPDPEYTFVIDGSGNIITGKWQGSPIDINKGGTGKTSYSNGQLLIGSGTSLAANTLTAGTGISISNGSGTITVNANVKDIVAGNNITVTSSSGTYTINSTAAGGAGLQSSSYVSQGKLSGNQSVTSGSDAVIQFVDDYDPQSWFDTTTRRFQPNIAGYYLISVGAWMDDADTTNGQANVQIRLNNNTILLVQNQLNDITGLSLTGSKAVYLNGTTDYIDFTFYHSTGNSRSLLSGGDGTWFTAVFLAWSAPPIGTQNYISKFGTSGSGVVNSLIFDNGTGVGIGTASPSAKLDVQGSLNVYSDPTNLEGSSITCTNNGINLSTFGSAQIVSIQSATEGDGTINIGNGYNDTTNLNSTFTNINGWAFDGDNFSNSAGSITSLNMTIGGNLIVNGTTTTVNVDTVTIEDPILTLGMSSGTIIPNLTHDRGLALVRGTGLTAFMGWDTSASQFVMLSSGVSTNSSGNYDAGTYGNLQINNLNSSRVYSSRLDISDGINDSFASFGAGGDTRFIISSSGSLGLGSAMVTIDGAPFYVTSNGTIQNGTWNASTIAVNKGGTGRTSYSNGQLLIGSGTSLIANTITAGTGISITNGSGTITINTSGLQTSLTNAVTGVGTSGYLTKWISGSTVSSGIIYDNGTNIGIGTTNPGYKLQVSGSFGATTKSFRIEHPSKPGFSLEYGSLESPYHGVRLTGRDKVIKGTGIVQLPDYLKDLIHDDNNLNIQITNIKHGKTIYVDSIDLKNDCFIVKADRAKSLGDLHFFWTLTGVRKDVENLVVEKRN